MREQGTNDTCLAQDVAEQTCIQGQQHEVQELLHDVQLGRNHIVEAVAVVVTGIQEPE